MSTAGKVRVTIVAELRKVCEDLGAAMIATVNPGDSVTIRVPAGMGRDGIEWKERTGRAVIVNRGTGRVALNMGGRHGTPGVATKDNIVRVRAGRRA